MRRNRLYAFAMLVTVAVVAGPALATTVQSHAPHVAKRKTSTKVRSRGPRGPRGARGPRGRVGASGRAGATGASGSAAGSFLRTIVVSPGATASAGGTALLAAVSGIAGASVTTPYLIWIEPGAYELGTTPLRIPSDVDVQGSGQDVTTIEGVGPLTLSAAAATEVRQLTVTDINTAGSADAIDTSGGLRDLTAIASASGSGAATGVLANGSTMPLVDVTASASGSGTSPLVAALDTQNSAQIVGGAFTATDEAGTSKAVALYAESSTSVSDATLSAGGGSLAFAVYTAASNTTVTVNGSTLVGAGGLYVAAGDTLDIGGSQVPGAAPTGSGTVHCPDDWLAGYATANADCS
jgi:hypothetical protein